MKNLALLSALALTLAASPALAGGGGGSMGGHSMGGHSGYSGHSSGHAHMGGGMGSHGMNAGGAGGAGGSATGIGYGGSGTGIGYGGAASLNSKISTTSTFRGQQTQSLSHSGNSSIGNVGGGTSNVKVNASPVVNVWASAPSGGGFLSGDSGLIVGAIGGYVIGSSMNNHGPSCPVGSTVGYMGDCQPPPQPYPVYMRGQTRVKHECMEAGTHWSPRAHECVLKEQGRLRTPNKVAQAN